MPSPASHLRAPLLWLLVPLMTGLVAARLWPVPGCGLGPVVIVAGASAVGAIICAIRPGRVAAIAWAGCLGLAMALGGFVLLHARHPTPPVDARPPREVTVTIEVRQPFGTTSTSRQFSGVGAIAATQAEDSELVGWLVYYAAVKRISVPPQRTGRYLIRGVLEPLPRGPAVDGFTDYLINLGVSHRLTRAHVMREIAPPGRFAALCARAAERLEHILRLGLADRPQTASLYVAMLLGGKAALSADQQNAYMRSGTFHVFSISGLHVGVIALALLFVSNLLRIPRRWGAMAGLVVLWVYVQVTGGGSPAMRSYLMIVAFTMSRSFRLPGNPLAALVAAALVTLLLDPLQLFSTGFQMSYSVVIALLTMGRPLGDRWTAAWKPFALLPRTDWRWPHRAIESRGRIAAGNLAACWTAFLASTPSGIGYFQLLSPGSLVANLVIIPLSSFVICAGFVSLLAGFAGLATASAACNTVAAWTIEAMDWLLQRGTALPAMWFAASFRTGWLAPVSVALMTAVFLAGSAVRWSPRYGGFWPPAVLLALLVIFGVKFD
jgi:competence protein ComEC